MAAAPACRAVPFGRPALAATRAPSERRVAGRCRVEPKGASDTFIVHGQACSASKLHPTCTHDPASRRPPEGRSYTIDISDVMGPDLAVTPPPPHPIPTPAPHKKNIFINEHFAGKSHKQITQKQNQSLVEISSSHPFHHGLTSLAYNIPIPVLFL